MFFPKYTITQSILKNVGLIDAAKEIVDSSQLPLFWQGKVRFEALARNIHHSTHLEGNALDFEQVQEVLEGKEVLGSTSDIQEVVNCQKAFEFLDTILEHIGKGRQYIFTLETIHEIHRLTTFKILDLVQSGEFRLKQVVVRNVQTGEISYTPPPAAEIPYLMEDLINWINSDETKLMHPVIKAGIVHFEIGRIHPFVDGNGRVARLIANLLLCLDGYDFGRLFCLDEFYDQDVIAYFTTMQSVSNQAVPDTYERDLTSWLEYFVSGAKEEFSSLKEKVKRISTESKAKDKLGQKIVLGERQMIIIEYLNKHKAMKNSDFRKMFPDLSDDTVLREIKFLKQKGLVKKIGGTKRAQYVLKN